MNIKNRIWSLPIISAAIFGLGLAVSSYYSTIALEAIERTGAVDYPVLSQSGQLRGDVQALSDDFKNAVLEGDKKRLDTIAESANKLRARFTQLGAIAGQKAHSERLSSEFNQYYNDAAGAARIMLEVDKGDVPAAIAKMQASLAIIGGDLEKTVNGANARFKSGVATSASRVQLVLTISIAVAAIVICSLALVAWFVIRAIWRQLGGEPEYARKIAQTVADGDLSIRIDFDPRYSGSLLGALVEMRARLEGIVGGIQGAASEIRVASAEIASGNANLSSRTETQAGNIGRAARSMGDLTSTVQHNAESARHANELADAASGVAAKGGRVVAQVVDTMNDINTSARKISDIIGVIDSIAFQTNILALNAAVEAARAGEQGRGFAVVASEVRNLAHRSASAAKEIKQLIDDSATKVSNGSRLVEDAGSTMTEIVHSVEHVSKLIREISASSQEQSRGLENLSRSVTEMDESTQQNAAMTEQAAAAADSLQAQAQQMSEAVGVFKLPAGAGGVHGGGRSAGSSPGPSAALLLAGQPL